MTWSWGRGFHRPDAPKDSAGVRFLVATFAFGLGMAIIVAARSMGIADGWFRYVLQVLPFYVGWAGGLSIVHRWFSEVPDDEPMAPTTA